MDSEYGDIEINGEFVTVAAVIVALYFYNKSVVEKERSKRLSQENLKLIYDSIHSSKEISKEVQIQLEELVIKFKHINLKISNEVAQALQLVQIGQTENAIEDLAKIIENLLQEMYSNSNDFNSWLGKRRRDFQARLEFCKFENKITKVEFDFFKAVKTIRNEEDHVLDLSLPNYLNASGLIVGIGGIYKIASFVYPEVLELK